MFKLFSNKIRAMENGLIWLGPIAVLAFVVLLAVMYGWVGKMEPWARSSRSSRK